MEKKKGIFRQTALRRGMGILLAAVLVCSALPVTGFAASDAENTSVEYREAAWTGSQVTYTNKTASCTPVESATTAWTQADGGWYVVNSTVTIAGPVTVTGAVNLILADGCTLNAESGIVVPTGSSLTIYAQSGGSGTLNATGIADNDYNASAGIGGNAAAPDSGKITIHGGVINATGGGKTNAQSAAGIGGGVPSHKNGGSSGAITIYGGTITAKSGEGSVGGAGIGGGGGVASNGGSGSKITICGGSVTAESTGSRVGGAGIGGGAGDVYGGDGNNIRIYGGTVNAKGSFQGAGIGGGSGTIYNKSGDGTGITISGGVVTAVGGQYAAGIGGGGGLYSETAYSLVDVPGGTGGVTISGGIVDAKGGDGDYDGAYAGQPIGDGGNAPVPGNVTKTAGIIFENGEGTVHGNVTLTESFSVPDGYTLTIPSDATLSGGELTGGGTLTVEDLTADMISIPKIHYTSDDMREYISQQVKVSFLGHTAEPTGWTLVVTKESDIKYTVTYTHTKKEPVSITVNILPCTHESQPLTRHEKIEADCTKTGVEAHWECPVCKKKFSDQAGTKEMTDADIVIEITPHTLTHYEKQESTCTAAGKIEYWGCSVCGKKFSDQAGTAEIADADIGIPMKPHTLTHHEKVEAVCLTEGSLEYWSCGVCNKRFSDADGKSEITEITIPAPGHAYGAEWQSDENSHWHECTVCKDKSDIAAHTEDSGSVTKPATETETGIRTYKCSVCQYVLRTEEIEKLPPSHTHHYGTEWKSDNTNHWHECSCGDKSGTAAHALTQGSDSSGHWQACSVCGWKSAAAAHTYDNRTDTTCNVCGYVRTVTPVKPNVPDSPSNPGGSGGTSNPGTPGGSTTPSVPDAPTLEKENWNVVESITQSPEKPVYTYTEGDGTLATGSRYIEAPSGEGRRYLFDEKGVLVTGAAPTPPDSTASVYISESGDVLLNGHLYYLNPSRNPADPRTCYAMTDYLRIRPNYAGQTYYNMDGITFAGWIKTPDGKLRYQARIAQPDMPHDLYLFVWRAQILPAGYHPDHPGDPAWIIPAGRYLFDDDGLLVQEEGWHACGDGKSYYTNARGQILQERAG